MCISLATAAAIASATAGVAGAVQGYESSRRARRAEGRAAEAATMARQAEGRAAQDANARVAMRRRALAQNSLFTGGGDMGSGMSAPGKATLGG